MSGTFDGRTEDKHPASRLETFMRRSRMAVRTIRCRETGRSEVLVVADGFDADRTLRRLEQTLAPAPGQPGAPQMSPRLSA